MYLLSTDYNSLLIPPRHTVFRILYVRWLKSKIFLFFLFPTGRTSFFHVSENAGYTPTGSCDHRTQSFRWSLFFIRTRHEQVFETHRKWSTRPPGSIRNENSARRIFIKKNIIHPEQQNNIYKLLYGRDSSPPSGKFRSVALAQSGARSSRGIYNL